MSHKPKIIYWNNMPSPYHVDRLNKLVDRGNLNIEAWFQTERGEGDQRRSWDVSEEDWRFQARYIPASSTAGRQLHIPLPELSLSSPDMVVSLMSDPSFVIGALLTNAYEVRHVLRVLPTYDAWVRRSRQKELLKRFIYRAIDGAKASGEEAANVAAKYGVPHNRIFRVTQSIDVDHYSGARLTPPDARERERTKRGLRGCTFLFVGRLWSGKGLDTLLDAYKRLIESDYDISLLIVGDGIEENYFRTLAHRLPNVHFEGFVQASEMPGIYALADVFVFPTRGDPHGLVVEEAMAAGLAIISSRSAGDIEARILDGKAGLLFPTGDVQALAASMTTLACKSELREKFALAGLRSVQSRYHDQYATDFENMVEAFLRLPKRMSFSSSLATLLGRGVVRLARSRPEAKLVGK